MNLTKQHVFKQCFSEGINAVSVVSRSKCIKLFVLMFKYNDNTDPSRKGIQCNLSYSYKRMLSQQIHNNNTNLFHTEVPYTSNYNYKRNLQNCSRKHLRFDTVNCRMHLLLQHKQTVIMLVVEHFFQKYVYNNNSVFTLIYELCIQTYNNTF